MIGTCIVLQVSVEGGNTREHGLRDDPPPARPKRHWAHQLSPMSGAVSVRRSWSTASISDVRSGWARS